MTAEPTRQPPKVAVLRAKKAGGFTLSGGTSGGARDMFRRHVQVVSHKSPDSGYELRAAFVLYVRCLVKLAGESEASLSDHRSLCAMIVPGRKVLKGQVTAKATRMKPSLN